jgi:hypothetical protein
VEKLGRLVEDHVTRSHFELMLIVMVVEDEEQPGLGDLLVDVDDGRDHMRGESVHMHA